MRTALRLAALHAGSFNPLSLLGAEGGFYFDFANTGLTFQEGVSGLTPADDNNEAVGTSLEESRWGGKTLSEFSESQPEMLSNGGFDTDTVWTKGAAWTISGGTANVNAVTVASNLFQTIAVTQGRTYAVTFTVSNFVSGVVFVRLDGTTDVDSVTFAANGTYTVRMVAPAGVTTLVFRTSASFTNVMSIDNVSCKEILGAHGTQTTDANRPLRKTGGFIQFDGSNDALLTGRSPSETMTLVYKGRINAAAQYAIGTQVSSVTRSGILAETTSGFLAGRAGSASFASTVDIRGLLGVGAMSHDGTTVKLYWNGVEVYSGAQTGTPTVNLPYMLGAVNNNGTAATWMSGDLYKAFAVNRVLAPAEVRQLTNFWGIS
jgi:hypothetical protein